MELLSNSLNVHTYCEFNVNPPFKFLLKLLQIHLCVLFVAHDCTLIILTSLPVISLLAFLHLSVSFIAHLYVRMYVCSVLLRLEKQSRRGAGAVLSPGDDGPVWPDRAEEWLEDNQTFTPRWVGGVVGCYRVRTSSSQLNRCDADLYF